MSDMFQEHGVILRLWVVLGKILAVGKESKMNFAHVRELLPVMGEYVDGCHHAKEEVCFFPALRAKNLGDDSRLISELISEHERSRKMLAEIASAAEARNVHACAISIPKYRELIFNHIGKEGPFFARMEGEISQSEDDRIFQGFVEIEMKTFGLGSREKVFNQIKTVERVYGNVKLDPGMYRPAQNESQVRDD
jgi:hemerythrin-like domain-containing protein